MFRYLILLLPLMLAAKVHYAKMEPYDTVVLKASVSGQVLEVNLTAEGNWVEQARVIHIDDRLDKQNLEATRQSIVLLGKMLAINEEIVSSLAETVKRQESYYKRISQLATASTTQKDNAYSAFASAKTQYLGIKEKIASLKKQLLDAKYKEAMLEDTIEKKSLVLAKRYLYSLLVRAGDFVAPGTPLARVDDVRKAKLVLFLEPNELAGIEAKSVYLDDKKTDLKVNKVWRVADEKYISSYRAEIYIPAPQGHFSQLIKVELK